MLGLNEAASAVPTAESELGVWVVEEYILVGPFEYDDDAVGSESLLEFLLAGNFKGSCVTPEVT